MATSPSQRRKHRNLPVVVGLIGMFVVIALVTVACVLFLRLRSAERNAQQPRVVAIEQPSVTPPASAFMATPGPPAPGKIVYIAEEPVKGYSDCTAFGFKGMVTAGNGSGLQSVQIVVWDAKGELLALNNTDAEGNYSIEIQEPPARRKLWVQVYQDDAPVSRPVFLETQNDCENGFQVYRINWRRASSQ